MQPQFFSSAEIDELKKKHLELNIDDHISLAIDELYDIKYPAQKDNKDSQKVTAFANKLTGGKPDEWGEWVYYEWLNKLVHFPPVEELRSLRTSRNRNLINTEEQAKLYDATLLIIGMSVGSNIVEALVAHGIGKKLILVDMDIIEPSNLNRIRAPYHHVGLHKVEAISRKVWEIDPYIDIVQVNDGLNEENINRLMAENKIDVLVDEMDDLRMKIILREAAKAKGLPVVMAADDGDNSLVDIERYDLVPQAPVFNGRVPENVLERIKKGGIPRSELGMMIGKYFVGAENIPLRMYQSLGEVGKTLPSWPQLGGAAALSGLAVAYAIRKILLGEKLQDGRVLVSIDERLDLEQHQKDYQDELRQFQERMSGSGPQ